MRKRSLLALLASALVAGVAAAPAATAAEPETKPGTSTINWGPCPDPDVEGVDCATIEVPLDYAKPRGEKIRIGLARRPATDPSKRIGSVLLDPGGPAAPASPWSCTAAG